MFNKIKKILTGGIERKIITIVLIIILLSAIVLSSIVTIQWRRFASLINNADEEQLDLVVGISTDSMIKVTEGALSSTTRLKAAQADTAFSSMAGEVWMLGNYLQKVYENSDVYPERHAFIPDASREGQVSVQLLTEEGVSSGDRDVADAISLVANLSDLMYTIVETGRLNSCFIGIKEGAMLLADRHAGQKYDENGKIKRIDVRNRPWYEAAKKYKTLIFTSVEKDVFTGLNEIVCAMPVYHKGEVVAVVGADLFLEDLADGLMLSGGDRYFTCIINEDGQVICSSREEGTFAAVDNLEEAQDLRKCKEKDVADFVTEVFRGNDETRLVNADGEEWYMAGSMMPVIEWAVVSVVSKSLTESPAQSMVTQLKETFDDTEAEMNRIVVRFGRILFILLASITIIGIILALVSSRKIVLPLKEITRQVGTLGGSQLSFEMKDAYRTGDEVESLAEAFARLSGRTLEYVNEVRSVTAEKERIGVELNMAKEIQSSQLPSIFPPYPDRSEFDIFANMIPAKEVGGDFYDFFLINRDHLALVIADVSGKGVPAALFMMVSRILIKNHLQGGESLAEAFEKVNTQLLEGNQYEMFVTCWAAVIEISTGKGVEVNAGHEHPAIRRAGGQFELSVYKHNMALATIENIRYRERPLELEPGDSLFVYTDGAPEANNEAGELFGTDRMLEALNRDPGAEPEQILKNVSDSISEFIGSAQQFDDLTMLCFTYRGSAGAAGPAGKPDGEA